MLSFSEALISRRGPSLRVSPDRRAARRGRGWGIDWVREISGWSDPLAVGCARTPHKCCEGWLRRICESVCARVCGRSREGGRGGKHRVSHSLPTYKAPTHGLEVRGGHPRCSTHLCRHAPRVRGRYHPSVVYGTNDEAAVRPDITGLGFLQSPLLHGRRLAGAPVSRTAPQASTDGATPARLERSPRRLHEQFTSCSRGARSGRARMARSKEQVF